MQLEAQVDRHQEIAALHASIEGFCLHIQRGLDNATFEQRRQLVELLIDRVIVTESDVEIHYVIPTTPASEHIRFCHLRTDYRHHLHCHRPGLAVAGNRDGLVLAQDCRLVDEPASEDRFGQRCLEDGIAPTLPPSRLTAPFGSG